MDSAAGGLQTPRTSVPTPDEQVAFLRNVQRLLTDGQFVATYKFALLRSLADLAVLKGDDSGAELVLTADEIAGVFVELYWRQTRPFHATGGGDGRGRVLRQNTGRQAAVVRAIADAQATYGGSIALARRDRTGWATLTRETARVVAEMPLWKLQRVGEEVVDFLYPDVGSGRTVRLRPGVAYCLRSFYGILRNLVEGAWVNYVRRQNLDALGHGSDLGDFLFGAERAGLDSYRPILAEVQKNTCFYCRTPLGGRGEVDHFVPWSRYPVDFGHNFVLAHAGCNGRKSDRIGAERHLASWVERNDRHAALLREYFERERLRSDLPSSLGVARWAYEQTARSGGLVWVQGEQLEHLTGEWRSVLFVSGL